MILLPHKVKTQYLHFRSHAEYFLLSWKIPEVISRWSILFYITIKGVSTISNIWLCTYILLVWKWIDEKFDIKWMYLLCFIFVDTVFYFSCGQTLNMDNFYPFVWSYINQRIENTNQSINEICMHIDRYVLFCFCF